MQKRAVVLVKNNDAAAPKAPQLNSLEAPAHLNQRTAFRAHAARLYVLVFPVKVLGSSPPAPQTRTTLPD